MKNRHVEVLDLVNKGSLLGLGVEDLDAPLSSRAWIQEGGEKPETESSGSENDDC